MYILGSFYYNNGLKNYFGYDVFFWLGEKKNYFIKNFVYVLKRLMLK